MQASITLEDGREISVLSKTELQSEAQQRQPVGSTLPTRKADLQRLLSHLLKIELMGRGTFGSLPDWRPIHELSAAVLRMEIRNRSGQSRGNVLTLRRELEQLVRAELGLPPRPVSPVANGSPLSPQATAFVPAQAGSPAVPPTIVGAGGTTSPTPMGTNASPQLGAQLDAPVFSPQVGPAQPTLGNLAVPPAPLPSPPGVYGASVFPQVPNLAQPLGTQLGPSVFSPFGPHVQHPQGQLRGLVASPVPFGGGLMAQNSVFSVSSAASTLGEDLVIEVAAGTALRIAAENLREDSSSVFCGGKIKLTDLSVLFGHVTMDSSAGGLPVGSILSPQAFTRIHNAIAEQLLASPRVSSQSEFFKLCQHLVMRCSVVVTATDFALPQESISIGAATDYFKDFPLIGFGGLNCFYKVAALTKICGGFTSVAQRDPTTNPNLRMVLDDLSRPVSKGGLFSDVLSRLDPSVQRPHIFKNFLEFQHTDEYSAPLDLNAYFILRSTDDGIRNGSPESIDSAVSSQVSNPANRLDNLARMLCDTPLTEMVPVINALKAVIDPSLSVSPNSILTLQLVNAKLFEFDPILPPLPQSAGPRLSSAHAMSRVQTVQDMRDSARQLSSGNTFASGSSRAHDGTCANAYAAAGVQASPVMKHMETFPNDEEGQEDLLATAIQARLAFFVGAMTKAPTQQQVNAFKTVAKLHAVTQTHFPSYIAKMILVGYDQLNCPGLHLQLTAALDSVTLLGMLKGDFPKPDKLLEMYGRFRSILSENKHFVFTIRSVSVDLHEFDKFIKFIHITLTALGFNAEDLPTLVTKAKALECITNAGVEQVLESTLVPSLEQTLKAFSVSIHAWMLSLDSSPPPPLQIKNGLVQEATEGVKAYNKMNYFRLGIQQFTAPPLANAASSSSQAAASSLPQVTRPSSAEAPSSNKRAKASPSTIQGSNVRPLGYSQRACSVGLVVHWGDYFNGTNVKQAFCSKYPEVAWNDSYFPCLLAKLNTSSRFLSYVPLGTSEETIRALRAWYTAGRGKAFKIAQPLDFQ